MNPSGGDKCSVCGSRDGVRQFAVTINGSELRAVAWLCTEHGEWYLLAVGRALGAILTKGKA